MEHDELARNDERPLVTFALFAYNQEKYIREAVEGAFSQSYQPLEIILSDDCSVDATFRIMQEMASAYKGPHSVIVRKTDQNRRPLNHVVEVARIAKGDLIVVAAGDDISNASRTDRIVDEWCRTDAWAFHSRYDKIDDTGKTLEVFARPEDLFSPKCELRKYFYQKEGNVFIVHGATSAYDRRVFDFISGEIPGNILSEDAVISVILNIYRKKISFLEQSLIRYRSHDVAITNASMPDGYIHLKDALRLIKREQMYAESLFNRSNFFLNSLNYLPNKRRSLDVLSIKKDIDIYGARAAPPVVRWKYWINVFAAGSASGKLGYLAPGLLGVHLSALGLFVKQNFRVFLRGNAQRRV